jgi:hypothetical protein
MPGIEQPVTFKGGPTQEGREGRIAETKWLQDWKDANETRSRLFDGLRELERFKSQLEDEVKRARANPDVMRRYLDEIERHKNNVREEYERLRDVVKQNEDLGTELLILDQYVTPEYKRLTDEVNRLIAVIEGSQEVTLKEDRLLNVFRNAPSPPPPPDFDSDKTQRFHMPEQTSEIDIERYQRGVRDVLTDAFTVLKMLRSRPDDPKVRAGLKDAPDEFERRLAELDAEAGSSEYEVRQDAEHIIDGIRLLLEEPAPPTAEAAVAPRRAPKGSSFVAWMPRVPAPPYIRNTVATLTAAPPPPPPATTDSVPTGDEDAALARLEQSLKEFNEQKQQLLAQHKAVVDEIQQRIRERKLQALRDTLNTPA